MDELTLLKCFIVADNATKGNPFLTMPVSDLLKATGLWDHPISTRTFGAVRAFYNRPWKEGSRINIDRICELAVQYDDVDPEDLINMCEAVGELKEGEWCGYSE